ncbi:TPA: hypothetical protein ACXJMC_003386 [Pseudomonas aeruginosa]
MWQVFSRHLGRSKGRDFKAAALIDLSTVADIEISNPPWVKFQSAGWVNFPSAPTAQVWELFEQNEAATYQLYLLDCALMNAHPARFSDWRGFMLERSPAEPEVEYSPVPGV